MKVIMVNHSIITGFIANVDSNSKSPPWLLVFFA